MRNILSGLILLLLSSAAMAQTVPGTGYRLPQLQNIPAQSVLGNAQSTPGKITYPWLVPNPTDTLIPTIHGPVLAGSAVFQNADGSLSACPVQANQFFTRAGVPVDPAYCQLVSTLLANGIWNNLCVLDIFASATQSEALLNRVSASFAPTLTGTVSFTNDGFAGNGTDSYVNTNFNPATDCGKYTATDSYMAVWDATSNMSETADLFGANDGAYFTNFAGVSGGNAHARINAAAGNPAGAMPMEDIIGLEGCGTTTALGESCYQNDIGLAGGISGPGIPNATVYVGGQNDNGTFANGSTDRFSVFVAGGGLTLQQINALYFAIKIFLTAPTQAPAYATAWGFTSNKLYENWSEGLAKCCDVNNTLAPGYGWYISPSFGSLVPPAADFSLVPGGLQIDSILPPTGSGPQDVSYLYSAGNTTSYFTGTISNGSGGSGNILNVTAMAVKPGPQPIQAGQKVVGNGITGTAVIAPFGTGGTTGTGGIGTYSLSASFAITTPESMYGQSNIGTTFSPGGYYESCFVSNPANSPSTNLSIIVSWPAWWMASMVGFQGFPNNQNYLEIDHFEAFATNTVGQTTDRSSTNAINFSYSGGNVVATLETTSQAKDVFALPQASAKGPNPHCFGTLWVLTSQNAGTGLLKYYIDGWYSGISVSYSATGGSDPASTPDNPNGVIYQGGEVDGGPMTLVLDAGYGNPIVVSSVAVWH